LNFHLPKIYPITDTAISRLSHAEQVKRLIAGGARLIQLRDKMASSEDFYRSSVEALCIAAETGCSIIINDRIDIAYAAGASGVHLGQDDVPASIVRERFGDNFIIGLSTNSPEQVLAALRAPIDYIAVGPIFDTKTKEKTLPSVGTVGIKKARAAIGTMPMVAIGGIDAENLKLIFDAGADSAAIISGILCNPEQISEKIRRLNDIAEAAC
jgi:thiamine-phosphate pyrophosphorylase